MRAAEKLFAERGVENVTVRAIIEQSGQKNESALQYHFKNRQGLIDAIHQHRNAQVQEKRSELLVSLLQLNPTPTLREICGLMVEPTFLMARNDTGFRQWVKAFGQAVATFGLPALLRLQVKGNQGTLETVRLLREKLSHLDDQIFEHRIDSTIRFVGLSMSQQAREKQAFRGAGSDVFLNMLVDSMAGLLAAEVSEQTNQAIANRR
jgi:AcrR family transcriptional regulator